MCKISTIGATFYRTTMITNFNFNENKKIRSHTTGNGFYHICINHYLHCLTFFASLKNKVLLSIAKVNFVSALAYFFRFAQE